jgi:predicted PurR-regulated permease PerM
MYDPDQVNPLRLRRILLATLAFAITLLFLWMISEFLLALLFAAILSGMFHPLYRRLVRRFGNRKGWAAATTVFLVFVLAIGPLIGFSALVTTQAIELGAEARTLVEARLRESPRLEDLMGDLPMLQKLRPYREQILAKAGELAGQAGALAVRAATEGARQAVTFLLMLFITLYAMFFFLLDGRTILRKILYYLPLPAEDENQMLDRFVSVTRATIKGTLVVGVVQGALAGLAFWAVGIEGAALWGTVMAVLSVLPGIGTALIWIPAVIYLFVIGRAGAATGLLIWCAAVVGTIDNVLRPFLVGKDTKMSDLLILLSTLGGIVLFGFTGFVVGPIVAALFVTVWDLYGMAFADILPEPDSLPSVVPPPVAGERDKSPREPSTR